MDEISYRQAGFTRNHKSKRINWRNKAITRLQDDLGMTKQESVTYFNNLYRKALKTTQGHQTNLNTTKELYASMFYQTALTFQIDSNQKVTLNPIIANNYSKNVAQGIALSRMEHFFDKYKDDKALQNIKNEYLQGTISRLEFNEKIKNWKSTSQRYLISGSY